MDKPLRTYYAPHSNLYFVISKGSIQRADCFSRGFSTRAEAQAYRKRLIEEASRTGLSLWDANKQAHMWPDNGQAKQ